MPNLGYHLMSVSELCKLGMRVIFDEHSVSVQEKSSGREVRRGSVENGVYKLHARDSVQNSSVGELWPGHMKNFALRHVVRDQLVDDLPEDGACQRQCISCIRGKQHSEAFSKASRRHASELLELVHTDVSGPVQTH